MDNVGTYQYHGIRALCWKNISIFIGRVQYCHIIQGCRPWGLCLIKQFCTAEQKRRKTAQRKGQMLSQSVWCCPRSKITQGRSELVTAGQGRLCRTKGWISDFITLPLNFIDGFGFGADVSSGCDSRRWWVCPSGLHVVTLRFGFQGLLIKKKSRYVFFSIYISASCS